MVVIKVTHNLLSSITNGLENLDNSIHEKIDGFFVDNFIHELQDYLTKWQSAALLSSLRPYSLLTFAKNDGNFAVCFDYKDKKIYYVPQQKITGNKPELGEALKVIPNGTFHVDYTAILAEESKIDEYLSECTIAK